MISFILFHRISIYFIELQIDCFIIEPDSKKKKKKKSVAYIYNFT